MQPRKFIEISGKIVVMHWEEEARSRTAISRSYYGAFHHTADVLKWMGIEVGEAGSAHARTPQVLMGCDDDDVKGVGVQLSDLGELRRKADYRLEPRKEVDSFGSSKAAVITASKICDFMDRFKSDAEFMRDAKPSLIIASKRLGLRIRNTSPGGALP